MDFLSKLPLVGLFAGVLAASESSSGPLHTAVKAAAAAFGNDAEKRLAADDNLWDKLVTTVKDVAAVVAAIEADVAG